MQREIREINFWGAELINKIHRESNMTQVVNERKSHGCYQQSCCSFFNHAARPDCSWCPSHLTCVDCLSASVGKNLTSRFLTLFCTVLVFMLSISSSGSAFVCRFWSGRYQELSLQRDPGSYSAEENLASMQRVHIKNLPAPLSVLAVH